ncbi:hypothetical protein KA405_06905 [Patescibacteria group bacterium]|nr:hypothetical protein [Patescibacteria group bacterium]
MTERVINECIIMADRVRRYRTQKNASLHSYPLHLLHIYGRKKLLPTFISISFDFLRFPSIFPFYPFSSFHGTNAYQ